MNLKRLSRQASGELLLEWADGHVGPVSLESLRDHCPCATCKGEAVLLHRYVPPAPDKATPGRYELRGAEPVGSYAMKFIWGDGHDHGIYTWEILRGLCACARCRESEEPKSGR